MASPRISGGSPRISGGSRGRRKDGISLSVSFLYQGYRQPLCRGGSLRRGKKGESLRLLRGIERLIDQEAI
ncbi:hypothetical protein Bca101_015457 [Brassica carinata]